MALVFKLGSIDLSAYVRVAKGEGLDPYDSSGFNDPQFGSSPFAEGRPLLNEDTGNREQIWPLHLNALTKDAAHALVRSINLEIAGNPALRVEWKDDGASNSTFYDVTFARFDPDFDYRRSARNWESGMLRTWCAPPYGNTGAYRLTGTAISPSSVAFTVPVPSIAGDAPALVDVRISTGTGFVPDHGRVALAAALPHASYAFLTPAGSLAIPAGYGVASLVGASGAIGSQVVYFRAPAAAVEAPLFTAALSPASVYAGGRHRVMAVMRGMNFTAAGLMTMSGPDGRRLEGAVPAVPSAGWNLNDLGVMSVPSTPQTATLVLTAMGIGGGIGATYSHFSDDNAADTHQICALIVVPEDRFQLVVDAAKRGITNDNFGSGDFAVTATAALAETYDLLGNRWFTPSALPGGATIMYRIPYGAGGAGIGMPAGGRRLIAADSVPINDLHIEQRFGVYTNGTGVLVAGKLEKVATGPRAILGQRTATAMTLLAVDAQGATTLLQHDAIVRVRMAGDRLAVDNLQPVEHVSRHSRQRRGPIFV